MRIGPLHPVVRSRPSFRQPQDVRSRRDGTDEPSRVPGGREAHVTVNAMVVVRTFEPNVPVTVTVNVPVRAPRVAVRVRVDVPGATTEVRDSELWTPLGTPETERRTVPANPPVEPTVSVELAPGPPRRTVTVAGV